MGFNILRIISALLLTLGIEALVLIIFGEARKKVYLGFLIMNVLTNVPLNIFSLLTYDKFISSGIENSIILYNAVIIPCFEILIIIIESLAYYLITKEKKKSAIYGIFCNGYSYLLGIIICFVINIIFSR